MSASLEIGDEARLNDDHEDLLEVYEKGTVVRIKDKKSMQGIEKALCIYAFCQPQKAGNPPITHKIELWIPTSRLDKV